MSFICSCQEVDANTTATVEQETATPEGKTIGVSCFSANSPIADNTHVTLCWGDTPIWVIWAEGVIPFCCEFPGDGSTKLKVKLHNDTAGAVLMAGGAKFEEY
jgi:hypothetical protein